MRCRNLILPVIFSILPSLLSAAEKRLTLSPGVEYTQEITRSQNGPLLVNILRINLQTPGARVETALGQDVVITDDPTHGRESLGSIATRHGALAAINGDFANFTGDPLNLAIRNGELVSETMPHRAAMGITAKGDVLFDTILTIGHLQVGDQAPVTLDGIDRYLSTGEIVILTPIWGAKIRLNSKAIAVPLSQFNETVRPGVDSTGIAGDPVMGSQDLPIAPGTAIIAGSEKGALWLRDHIHAGDTVRIRFDLVSNPLAGLPNRGALASRTESFQSRQIPSIWQDVVQAIGGGPWLVRNGQISMDAKEEMFNEPGFVTNRHPRSAAGVTSSGELLLVTVDGRQSHSIGATMEELARLMQRLGARTAINLDGGGSSMMRVRDLYVNAPSDGEPRSIANAILVFGDKAPPVQYQRCEPVTLTAGGAIKLSLPADIKTDEEPFWGSIDGRALITQNGELSSAHSGKGTVRAIFTDRAYEIPYTIEPGPPATFTGILGRSSNNPPDRNALVVRVLDSKKNPISGLKISVKVSGGSLAGGELITGADGRATSEIVWDSMSSREVVLTAGSIQLRLTAK